MKCPCCNGTGQAPAPKTDTLGAYIPLEQAREHLGVEKKATVLSRIATAKSPVSVRKVGKLVLIHREQMARALGCPVPPATCPEESQGVPVTSVVSRTEAGRLLGKSAQNVVRYGTGNGLLRRVPVSDTRSLYMLS